MAKAPWIKSALEQGIGMILGGINEPALRRMSQVWGRRISAAFSVASGPRGGGGVFEAGAFGPRPQNQLSGRAAGPARTVVRAVRARRPPAGPRGDLLHKKKAYAASLRSFSRSRTRIQPRDTSTTPSAAKYFSIRDTTSRALPM